MKLPWHKLGLPAGRGGIISDLKVYYGKDWEALSKYFLPTRRLATSINCPNLGGDGCPRKVVEHSFHDIVAVCGNSPKECESVPLTRQDLVIHELKIERLLADVAGFLQIKGTAPIQFMRLTWELGNYSAQSRPHIPVYISLQADPDKLKVAAISLISQKEKPFFLLVPSRDLCPVQLANTAEKAGIYLLGLDELLDGQNVASSADLLAKYVYIEQEDRQDENVFRKKGQKWVISFKRSDDIYCNDNKGFLYISYLLGYPGREIHCQQLLAAAGQAIEDAVGFSGVSSPTPGDHKQEGYGQHDSNGEPQDPLLDERALKEYKEHSQKLRQLIEQAETDKDFARKERYEKEYGSLRKEIIAASKLGGGSRDVTDDAEKARKSVSEAVRRTMKIIEKKHPELFLHLKNMISLGEYCLYNPGEEISWRT